MRIEKIKILEVISLIHHKDEYLTILLLASLGYIYIFISLCCYDSVVSLRLYTILVILHLRTGIVFIIMIQISNKEIFLQSILLKPLPNFLSPDLCVFPNHFSILTIVYINIPLPKKNHKL
uniref:Ovule protein n=1 Tax=Heterorhabditis bacteriophora TaxID=37862 RepID=A0A1I7WKH1_HETBA